MNVEILLITLLYTVTLAAFVGAINARGPARIAMSYFFAILCLCAAIFHTARYATVAGGLPLPSEALPGDLEPAAQDPAAVGQPAQEDAIIIAADSAAAVAPAENSRAREELDEARRRLQSMVETSMRLQSNLARISLRDIIDLPEEEFQYLKNAAVNAKGEAEKLRGRYRSMSGEVPHELEEAKGQVGRGVEALYNASYNFDRFFRAENEVEERMRRENFLREREQAAAFFRRALERL